MWGLISTPGHFKSKVDDATLRAAVAWVGEIAPTSSPLILGAPEVLDAPDVDAASYEYYRHWLFLTHLWVNVKLLRSDANLITSHGKVDMPGGDRLGPHELVRPERAS